MVFGTVLASPYWRCRSRARRWRGLGSLPLFAGQCRLCLCTCLLCVYRFGPLSRVWCMWFEAKNNYFKQMACVIGNYMNIARTLFLRHQRLSRYLLQIDNNLFLGDSVSLGRGTCTSVWIKGPNLIHDGATYLYCVHYMMACHLIVSVDSHQLQALSHSDKLLAAIPGTSSTTPVSVKVHTTMLFLILTLLL